MSTQAIIARIEKQKLYESSCKRKRRYTQLVANLTLQNLIEENGNKSRDLNLGVYPCEFCGYYHIGHNKGKII